MRSINIIPAVNFKDKPGIQAASTSDVRKLANRCWNTNSKTKTLPEPIPGPRHDGSRPTSLCSLPLLPSQQTFYPRGDPSNTLPQDRHCHSGLGGSSKEPFPRRSQASAGRHLDRVASLYPGVMLAGEGTEREGSLLKDTGRSLYGTTKLKLAQIRG